MSGILDMDKYSLTIEEGEEENTDKNDKGEEENTDKNDKGEDIGTKDKDKEEDKDTKDKEDTGNDEKTPDEDKKGSDKDVDDTTDDVKKSEGGDDDLNDLNDDIGDDLDSGDKDTADEVSEGKGDSEEKTKDDKKEVDKEVDKGNDNIDKISEVIINVENLITSLDSLPKLNNLKVYPTNEAISLVVHQIYSEELDKLGMGAPTVPLCALKSIYSKEDATKDMYRNIDNTVTEIESNVLKSVGVIDELFGDDLGINIASIKRDIEILSKRSNNSNKTIEQLFKKFPELKSKSNDQYRDIRDMYKSFAKDGSLTGASFIDSIHTITSNISTITHKLNKINWFSSEIREIHELLNELHVGLKPEPEKTKHEISELVKYISCGSTPDIKYKRWGNVDVTAYKDNDGLYKLREIDKFPNDLPDVDPESLITTAQNTEALLNSDRIINTLKLLEKTVSESNSILPLLKDIIIFIDKLKSNKDTDYLEYLPSVFRFILNRLFWIKEVHKFLDDLAIRLSKLTSLRII